MALPKPILSVIRSWKELGPFRFIAVILMVIAWIAAGFYLINTATYPARCPGEGIYELYACSFELPRTRGWQESGLFVWLWSTPILLALEVARRVQKNVTK